MVLVCPGLIIPAGLFCLSILYLLLTIYTIIVCTYYDLAGIGLIIGPLFVPSHEALKGPLFPMHAATVLYKA